QQVERELQQQGWLTRGRDGLELSPKALRRLGQTALRRVFERLEARGRGEHDLHDAGASGEPSGSSRGWEFGDEQPLDVGRTVGNAVRRHAVTRARAAGSPGSVAGGRAAAGGDRRVRLEVEDFEVVETERRAT